MNFVPWHSVMVAFLVNRLTPNNMGDGEGLPDGWLLDSSEETGHGFCLTFSVEGPVTTTDGRAVKRALDRLGMGPL
jgi:hypothetical protein